jgi:hypothetical protein
MSDDRPDEGREYHWPNGEVEVVFHVTNDGVVLTCVEYPSLTHFWATVDRDSIEEGDIVDAVRDLPSPEQLSDVDFDQFVE